MCLKVSFSLKSFCISGIAGFLDFQELRLGRVGKQADIHILSFFYTL